jgi:hypothetical protein
MSVPQPLVAAYQAAHYVVFGEPDIVLKVGEANAQLEALMDAKRAGSAAFVSGANPRGEPRNLVRNVVAFQFLKILLRKSRYLYYEGEGRDPKGVWPPEGSVLVLDMPRGEAEALGQRFAQNAIVYVERGGAPELVLLR